MTWNALTEDERLVIERSGTEIPFSGEYAALFVPGTYLCRRCHAPLYAAEKKFDAGCGWPTFDATFPDAVRHLVDTDGLRTEIRCAHCDAHLGHVFRGEHLTDTDTRHCVNSLSLRFIAADKSLPPRLSKE